MKVTHHIVEDKPAMAEFKMFEQAVKFAAVQSAPRAMQVISCFSLLSCIVVIKEL